jgi:DNA topoisomerase VI subunit B
MSAHRSTTSALTLKRETFRTSRLLDFCSEKELVAQIGHQRDDWPLVILKELVDNAIDACEEAGIAPVVDVTVDADGIAVRDNGPGLPAEVVEDILDFSIRVSSREAYVSPTRGAQGNALKTIVAMPFALDGEHGRIEIQSKGVRHTIDFAVDRIRQTPVVEHQIDEVSGTNGTAVRVEWPDSPRSILESAKGRFLQIAEDYGWLNPHLTISVDWAERLAIEATDSTWGTKKWLPSDPTSPHWYDRQHLERLVAGYIGHDADNGRNRTVRELVAEFRGLSSTAKQKTVLEATGLGRSRLADLVNGHAIDGDAIDRLIQAMRDNSRPVKPAVLGTIGREHFQKRFEAVGCEMESFDYRRVMDTTDGIPWVVETAFGWCPEATERRLVCGVNWSPGIVNPFRQLGNYGRSLDTVLSQARADRDDPVILVLHMACPRVEYTDRGKSAVVVRS